MARYSPINGEEPARAGSPQGDQKIHDVYPNEPPTDGCGAAPAYSTSRIVFSVVPVSGPGAIPSSQRVKRT